MNSFQQTFGKYTNEQQLFESDDRVLLSVSGGVDSSVLCHLFSKVHQRWAIAHVNFQLRGEESNQDEKFVQQLAERYDVPFFSRSFATQDFAHEQQISTQMAARQLRRTWSEELLSKEKFDYVALAHHHNDQLETLLLNLAKGGGIAGLRGMLPKAGVWIRPLLWATKEEILRYASQNQLVWREDHTNAQDKYQRNAVRHHIIPALQKINPALLDTTQVTFQRLREIEAIFQQEVKQVGSEAIIKKGDALFIRKASLQDHPQAASLLAEWLSPYRFSWHDVRQIVSAVQSESQPGKEFLSEQYRLWIDRDQLIVTSRRIVEFTSAEHDVSQLTITPFGQLQGQIKETVDYQINPDANVAALASEKLRFPLQIRRWQAGDAFQPLGMQHRKKVSDFLIDNKVPRYLKEKVLVLLSGDEIVWVIGHRVDDRFRLTEETKQVYEITWSPD